MNLQQCLGEGLLRKSDSASERVAQSLSLGDRFLSGARKNFGIKEYVVCEIISYNALFHYARAMLFKKGYIERSHSCLFAALKELYPAESGRIETADRLRLERHNLQYAGFSADRESAEFALGFAKTFGEAARIALGQEPKKRG